MHQLSRDGEPALRIGKEFMMDTHESQYDGWIQRMHCESCKNDFWVPDYGEGCELLTAPSYCPFCGIKFDKMILEGQG